MESLTAAELMVIRPYHIVISVLRSRSTQMPFSKNSSIGFPLKKPMEAKHLPWSNFKSLPFIVVEYDNGDSRIQKEAKVNLNQILRAKHLMTQRMVTEQFPGGRSRYRFFDDGFCTFTNEQIQKLDDQLKELDSDGYAVPQGLRKVVSSNPEADLLKVVPKEQVYNWIFSGFPYG